MARSALFFCAAVTAVRASFRPPAVPLAVSTPFFSIWSFGDSLASQTMQWHGSPATLSSVLRVDNATYVLMGGAGGRAATQLGHAAVSALTTRYAFSAGGVSLSLRFTTPALPADAEAASRSGTYIEWEAASADGAAHAVQVFFGASGEVVSGYAGESLEWDRPAVAGALAMRIGLVGQRAPGFNLSAHMRASTEPHQSQDFGFVYVLADGAAAASSVIAPQSAALAAFAAAGALPGAGGDAAPPAAADAADPTLSAVAFDLGALPAGGAAVRVRALLLCDEVGSVLNYATILPPLWRKDFPIGDTSVVPAAALAKALADGDALLAAADAFDAALAPALATAGGAGYANVTQLVFRQVTGANGVTWNGSAVWTYQKEISSDGDMSTLDVIFPSAPQHLYFDGAQPLIDLLEPLLFIMAGNSPVHFNQPCSFHSAGKWPVVDVGNGGCSMRACREGGGRSGGPLRRRAPYSLFSTHPLCASIYLFQFLRRPFLLCSHGIHGRRAHPCGRYHHGAQRQRLVGRALHAHPCALCLLLQRLAALSRAAGYDGRFQSCARQSHQPRAQVHHWHWRAGLPGAVGGQCERRGGAVRHGARLW